MGSRENELQDIVRNTLEYHEVLALIAERVAVGAELVQINAELRNLKHLSRNALKLAKADAQHGLSDVTKKAQDQSSKSGKTKPSDDRHDFLPIGFAAVPLNARISEFLTTMSQNVAWDRLDALVTPAYLRGAWPAPRLTVSSMMRLYFLQQWCYLSDEAIDQRIQDCPAVCDFVGIVPQTFPASAVLLRFKRILEQNGLTEQLEKMVIDGFIFHDMP